MDSALPSLRALKQARARAHDRMHEMSQADKIRWDAQLKPQVYHVDDFVLLRHESKFTLEYNWMGPYRVIATHKDTDTYKIVDMNEKPYASWVHADRLRKLDTPTNPTSTWYHPTIARAKAAHQLQDQLAIFSPSHHSHTGSSGLSGG